MPEKRSDNGVSVVRELVAVVAGPRTWTDTRQSWLARAARRAGISYRQCKSLFYGEITDPYHRSARLMRDAAERFEPAQALETTARAMESADANFYSEDIEARREIARAYRDIAGPGVAVVPAEGKTDCAGTGAPAVTGRRDAQDVPESPSGQVTEVMT